MRRRLTTVLAIATVAVSLGLGAGPALAEEGTITPFSGGATGCCRQAV
ncbi:hypothetical protein [Cellulomonas biazotea]|nr:hypothetical protein [Cellulomonas biazotea]